MEKKKKNVLLHLDRNFLFSEKHYLTRELEIKPGVSVESEKQESSVTKSTNVFVFS